MQIHDFLSNKIINYKTLSYDILIGLYVHIVLMFQESIEIELDRIKESTKNTSLLSLFDPLTLAISILILCFKKTNSSISNIFVFCFLFVYFTFTFTRRFYPKRLTVHSGYTFLSVCVPWESNPQPLRC